MPTIQLPGVIHGNTIQLTDAAGLVEGQRVRVTIEPIALAEPWDEWRDRGVDAFAESWTNEDDRILEKLCLDRVSGEASW